MSFALSQKRWTYVEGLGKVEVVRSFGSDATGRTAPVKHRKRNRPAYEVVRFEDFMRGKKNILKRTSYNPFIPLILTPFIPMKVFAETPDAIPVQAQTVPVHDKMMTAFSPIIDLVQSLAYPVALLVVLGGGLFVMIGNSDKGFQLIQRAGLGYVLVMMLPMLLDVLVDAMKSVV